MESKVLFGYYKSLASRLYGIYEKNPELEKFFNISSFFDGLNHSLSFDSNMTNILRQISIGNLKSLDKKLPYFFIDLYRANELASKVTSSELEEETQNSLTEVVKKIQQQTLSSLNAISDKKTDDDYKNFAIVMFSLPALFTNNIGILFDGKSDLIEGRVFKSNQQEDVFRIFAKPNFLQMLNDYLKDVEKLNIVDCIFTKKITPEDASNPLMLKIIKSILEAAAQEGYPYNRINHKIFHNSFNLFNDKQKQYFKDKFPKLYDKISSQEYSEEFEVIEAPIIEPKKEESAAQQVSQGASGGGAAVVAQQLSQEMLFFDAMIARREREAARERSRQNFEGAAGGGQMQSQQPKKNKLHRNRKNKKQTEEQSEEKLTRASSAPNMANQHNIFGALPFGQHPVHVNQQSSQSSDLSRPSSQQSSASSRSVIGQERSLSRVSKTLEGLRTEYESDSSPFFSFRDFKPINRGEHELPNSNPSSSLEGAKPVSDATSEREK